ncbi:MAG: nuclear transport factor 2 family protein [Caldilineaceae bacterium]|nr:nuclear transport factor 2 family protein [Caldilineaceae bacterium]
MNQQENIQVVNNLYMAFGRGDMPAILNVLAQDVDWLFVGRPEDVPFAGSRQGHEQMMEFFTIVGHTVDVLEFGPREIMAFDDKVLVLGHERVRVKATDQVFETDWAHLFTVQNGKITHLREYYDTATMAAAFHGH